MSCFLLFLWLSLGNFVFFYWILLVLLRQCCFLTDLPLCMTVMPRDIWAYVVICKDIQDLVGDIVIVIVMWISLSLYVYNDIYGYLESN